jgi:hypothetical protein
MVTLVLACHLTVKGMLLCKLPAEHKVYHVVVDTGSNVSSFVDAHNLRVTLSNGEEMEITPISAIPPMTAYNATAPKGQRIDGIIGEDFLSQFHSFTVDYRRGKITLVK